MACMQQRHPAIQLRKQQRKIKESADLSVLAPGPTSLLDTFSELQEAGYWAG